MNFLYFNNGDGIVSSLMSSWVFWLVIILVIVVILIYIISTNKNMQKKFNIEKYFENSSKTGNITSSSDYELDSIHAQLLNEINNENDQNGPNLHKYLSDDLDDESLTHVQLFGISESDKNVKTVYHVSSKKDNIFKITSSDVPENINFKLELKDLSKVTYNPLTTISEMKLYNQDRKCIALFTIDIKKIKIQSISPFMDDITIDIDEQIRLLVFIQKSNELFLDSMKIAKFNIYDKITYFYIKSPIIKELQYFEN